LCTAPSVLPSPLPSTTLFRSGATELSDAVWRAFDPAVGEGRPSAVSDGQLVTLALDTATPVAGVPDEVLAEATLVATAQDRYAGDRKSTRLNSSHVSSSSAVC